MPRVCMIDDFRLPIGGLPIFDCRCSKLETRNSKRAEDAPTTQWGRVSIFGSEDRQSTISNRQSSMAVAYFGKRLGQSWGHGRDYGDQGDGLLHQLRRPLYL